jgi:Leucine-rich repeat (LRR) protein
LRIAALDALTGAATAWNPGSGAITNINAIVVSGGVVYVGGLFTNIGGQPRSNIAAIDAAGTALPWNPNADNEVTTLLVNGAGTTVYAGGTFTNIGGQPRNRIAEVTIPGGAATAWNPNANGAVLCMALSGTSLYVGGQFTGPGSIGGQNRIRIAELSTSTGLATPWNPTATGDVSGIAISGTTVYICGAFTNCGGQSRNYIGALDATVNTLNATAWNPNADASASAIAVSGSNVFVGGAFSTVNATPRARFAAFAPPPTPLVVPASLSPTRNTNTAAASANINVVFDQTMNTGTYSAAKLIVHGNMRGKRTNGVYMTVPATTVNFPVTPARLPNELVSVTVTNATSAAGVNNRPFVYQFRTAAGAGPANFSAQSAGSPFAVGASPYSVTAGDFDGDGDLDLAVANNGSAVSILLNTGAGAYAAAVNYAVGAGPTSVTAGDFDGDGDLDLAVANFSDNTVSILLNTGAGAYAAAVNYAVGATPQSVTAGDFDGDGDLDLAVANYSSSNVNILRNTGSGAYAAAGTYAVGTNPRSVTAGDFDGDGDLDLAVTDFSDNNVSILLNTGAGAYAAAVNYAVGAGPTSVTAGDFDGDGDLDLAVANNGSATVSILLNTGAGVYAAAVNYGVGASPFSVTAGDFDGDGDLDLAVMDYISASVSILLNTGSGVYAAAVNYAVGTQPSSVTAGDFDGDGDLDLAVANFGSASVSILLNTVPMTVLGNVPPFTPRPATTPLMNTMNYGTPSGSPVKVPMNTVPTGISVTFSQNATAATFTDPTARNVMKVFGTTSRGYRSGTGFSGSGATMTFTTTANFNVGEQVWVSVTNAQSTGGAFTRPFVMGFRTAAGAGPANFSAQSAGSPFAVGASPYSVTAGDFDGDGDLDLAVANYSSSNVSILLNTGAGAYAAAANYAVGTTPYSVTAGDFDGDGDLDLAVANFSSANVSILLNMGAGVYAAAVNYAVGTQPRSVTAGDFDGDGDLDLAVANGGSATVSILLNTGSGAYAAAGTYAVGTNPRSVTAGDFDGDGDLDLAVANFGSASVSILRNTGAGAYAAAVNYAVGANPTSVTAGDFDGDGDLDLAVANYGSANVSILLNTGAGAYAAAVNYAVGANPLSVTAGDFDGDGDLDLAVANYSSSNVSILLNTGAGAYAAAVNYAVGANPYSVTAGDFDGDGDLDLAVANAPASEVRVFLNQNAPTRAGFGNALAFNGVNQTATLAASIQSPTLTNQITLEAWVNPGASYPASYGTIYGHNDVLDFGIDNMGRIAFRLGNPAGTGWATAYMSSITTIPLNAWSHLAVVYDGVNIRLYINGLFAGNFGQTGNVGSNGAVASIGSLSNTGQYFQGQIDELRVWNRAVGLDFINLYKGIELTAAHPNWANLIGYWKFNEYSGATAVNSSGGGATYNAMLVNTPTVVQSLAPVSIIAEPALGGTTTATLPATASGGPITFALSLPNPSLGTVAPATGNPVTFTNLTSPIALNQTDSFGYTATFGTSDSKTVTVRYRPRITASSQTVVPNVPTPLTPPTVNGGTGTLSYQWSGSPYFVGPTNIPNPVINTPISQSLTVTVTDSYGFSETVVGAVNVTVISGDYYYTGGDASNSANWKSDYGTGIPAPNFLTAGTRFHVMGAASGISTTVATMVNNMTLGAGVELIINSPAAFVIGDGLTFANGGTVRVRGNSSTGGTLQLNGAGSITGTPVMYDGLFSTVRYSGAGVTRPSSPVEFPHTTMTGTVIVDPNVTVTLDNHKTLPGGLVLGGLLDMSGKSVVLQGRLDLRGAFIANATSDLEIGQNGGIAEPITGQLSIATNIVRNFTMNRAGSVVTLGSPMLIQGGLSMARGILRSPDTNYRPIVVNPSFSAVTSSSDSSYVEGALERYFPANILVGGAGTWLFPVGRSGRYLPFSLVDPRTGGDAPLLRVEAFTGLPGGSVDSSLSQVGVNEYWNVNLLSGNHQFSRALLGRGTGIGGGNVPVGAVVAKAPTQNGVYTNIGGTVQGTEIMSGTFASFSTFSIGSPRTIAPPSSAPTISSFEPQTGTSGTRIVLTGTNLGVVSSVLVGGVPMLFTSVSSTQIVITLDNSAQTGQITLQTATLGTVSSFQPFTFIGVPTTATVSGQPAPAINPAPPVAAVGQEIVIRGNFFVPTPTLGEPLLPIVRIGGMTASSVEVISPTEMRVRFPAATSGTVTLQAWGGSSTTGTVVSILPPPQVRGIGPSPAAVGDTVTITGEDLRFISTLRIGGTIIPEYRVVNSTTITFVVPAGATTSTVTVLGTGGSTTSTTALEVIPPPVITGMSPSGGVSGQVITLTGREFTGATAVRFGNTTATFTVSPDGRSIQVIVPANVATGASVSVTTRGGTAVSPFPFAGRPSPDAVITGFEPVPVVEGGILTVRGENFPYNPNNTTATVFIGGVAVPGAFYTSDTTLVLRIPSGVVPLEMLSTRALVRVQTPLGSTTSSLSLLILAADAPAITGLSSLEGDAGARVVVMGGPFNQSARTTVVEVRLGGVRVESFRVTSEGIVIEPLGAVASGAIEIRTLGGWITTTASFRYLGLPLPGVASADSLALLGLYAAWGGDSWRERGGWGRGAVASWSGVAVKDGRVVGLNLAGNNLNGALSSPAVDAALAALSGLRSLDLSNNNLRGLLPSAIGTLRLLERLNVSKNKLEGELKNLCGMENLRELDIRQNGFRDSLSRLLCCLPRLETALLSENRLYGDIGSCVRELRNLRSLDASRNELSGGLPGFVLRLPSLEELRLRRSGLSGGLPPATAEEESLKIARQANEATLRILDLGGNAWTGALPSSWPLELPGVRELSLDSAGLSGEIPSSWPLWGLLQRLDLRANALSEAPDFRRVARLGYLNLADNALDFGSLESNAWAGDTSSYSPQAEVGALRDEIVPADAPWELTLRTGGTENRYRWQKRQASGAWSDFGPESRSARLAFATFSAEDAGEYRCRITNPLAPALTLYSRAQRLRFSGASAPPDAPVLIQPESGEEGAALRPVFVWSAAPGAAEYEMQAALDSGFQRIVFSARVAQSLEALESGEVETLSPAKLDPRRRYYWRALALNSAGASAWSGVRAFETGAEDRAFTARVAQFGRAPLGDTVRGRLRVYSASDSLARLAGLESLSADFAVEFAPSSSVAPFAPGERREYAARFTPSRLGLQSAGVRLRRGSLNSSAGSLEEAVFSEANRLRGVGSALKILPARALDTLLVGLPRVGAALIANVSPFPVEVRLTRVAGAGASAYAVKGATSFALGASDTAAAIVRAEALRSGALEEARLEVFGVVETNSSTNSSNPSNPTPGGVSPSERFADTAFAPLRSWARRREPWDLVARLGLRARAAQPAPDGAIVPGAGVRLELYLKAAESSSRDSLFRFTTPTLRARARYGNQPLSLSPQERAWRRIPNASAQNRLERVETPEIGFLQRGGETLSLALAVATAGESDTTALEIEDVDWRGVYLLEYETGEFAVRLSRAGGERRVGALAESALESVSLSPNPALDGSARLSYRLRAPRALSLRVVNALGAAVLERAETLRAAGDYAEVLDLRSLPSGSYTVVLRAGAEMRSLPLTVRR